MNRKNEVFDGVDFSHQDLSDSHFELCKFYNCNFYHTDLSDSRFIDCSFIEQGSVSGCDFEYANLQDSSFKGCQLSMVNFKGANCFGAEFRNCDLKGVNFLKARFTNQISNQVYFCSVYITGCNLSYANLERQCIEKCDLFENKWTGANFFRASLKGSDLSRGDFSSDAWGQFDVRGCDLSYAELSGLDPRKVDLSNVKICMWQQEQLLEPLGVIVGPD
ncbi:Qnr family pentapeptide repeat protein [Shewanella atlantica]|uniref:Qnr family pentapeptide repeat protein n=1 Tax=Shewanella atlantica TaxID=271099 RepID=A0A431VQ28_9GAMM|nr:Qnr family pentapeptide repeat protein [Shewanella atlantica]RTR25291.1 Qnr family pentapeptide repeat protein [Shewanella atlantica]